MALGGALVHRPHHPPVLHVVSDGHRFNSKLGARTTVHDLISRASTIRLTPVNPRGPTGLEPSEIYQCAGLCTHID